MRRIPLVLAFCLLTTAAGTVAAPVLRHFKEDHLTGAEYLRLSSSGSYELIGREHMGIWVLDRGTWTEQDGLWIFTSTEKKGSTFSCKVVQVANRRTFLVWSGEDAPGIEIPEDRTRAELAADPHATPPYVFFEVSKRVFDRETEKRYPFKYYPEMNRE